MRLIDADELEALFEDQVMRGPMDVFTAFDDAVRDAQTIDAVPVVRCRDCKYARAPETPPFKLKHPDILKCGCGGASSSGRLVYPTNFCSYGVSK